MIKKITKTIFTENTEKELSDKRGLGLTNSSVFLDLEHYIFHKPVALGIFGACIREGNELILTQFFLENSMDLKTLVTASLDYLIEQKEQGRDHLVTFAGKNDLMVLHSMFRKFNIPVNLHDIFTHVDLQKCFSREFSISLGLMRLEEFSGIKRTAPEISGSTIAKTFASIMKDPQYIHRMPQEKMDRLLSYNAEDVVNLCRITSRWGDLDRSLISNYLKELEEKRLLRELYLQQKGTVDPIPSKEDFQN